MTDDVTRRQIKVEKIVYKSEENKRFTEKINKNLPAPEVATAIAKIPNLTVKKLTIKKPAPILNKSTIIKIPHNYTLAKGLPKPKIYKDNDPIIEKNKHFTNFEAVLTNSTATPIRSHDGFTYTCCFCTDQYENPVDLKSHTLTTHNNSEDRREFMRKQTSGSYLLKLDITLLKCNVCDENIDTLEGLFDHLQNQHKKLIHKDVKNQIIPFKFGDDELKCVVCSLAFSKFKVLLNHMHTHYRNYECDVCDYGCINRRAMKCHEQSHKTGSFECSECNKVFQTRDRMRSHMKAVHKYKNMPNKCAVCKERFRSNKLKDQHLVTVHGMSPVIRKCTACDQTFTSQNLLRLHTKRFHLMERRFKCTECEMAFFAKNQLQYHMLKHTGRKDFQCDVCLKWFTRKSVLKEHMRIHMNDRRFTCLHCGRGFVQKCSWRSHMRTVHGEIEDKAISTS